MMFELKPVTKHIIWGGERLSRDYGMGENGEKIAEAWELTCRGDGDNEIISGNIRAGFFRNLCVKIRRHSEQSRKEIASRCL